MFYSEASLWDNAKWYDPSLGRFAQADSIVPGGVQGLDRYAYVNNSPMNYIDPTGHEPGNHCDRGYCDEHKNKIMAKPHFTKSPVSEEDVTWTQWFGGTENAFLNGKGWGYDKYCQGYHCGIDFGAEWGDPVFAGVNGRVYEPPAKGVGGYQVVIESKGYYILYSGLDGDFKVGAGDIVTPDTIIAGVGNHAADQNADTNYHLHLEVMHYSEGSSKWTYHGDLIENPLLYMDQSIYESLLNAEESSPPNNVTFHFPEQDPMLQPSPMHRGGTYLWP